MKEIRENVREEWNECIDEEVCKHYSTMNE